MLQLASHEPFLPDFLLAGFVVVACVDTARASVRRGGETMSLP
jgi:hypothetical protein